MATDAEILAAQSSAAALAINPRSMVQLCDRAVAEMLVDKQPKTYTIAGRAVTFRDFEEIAKIRAHFAGLVGGGFIVQDAEFES